MNSTTRSAGARRTAGLVLAYSALLAIAAALFLTVDFGPRSVEARDAVEVAVVPADIVPVAQAVLGSDTNSGALTGQIVFDGDAPKPAKLDTTSKDPEVCAANPVFSEELLVNDENKGIANVFIYLAKAPAGVKVAKPGDEPAVQDQKACRFTPHASLIRVGQKVLIKSGDPILHNTHPTPLRNPGFNQAIKANERAGVELTYTKMESLPIPVVCDFHPWMKAYHLILDHPYMALTDADGKFTIPDLPAGKHEFRIWHEKSAYLDRKYEVVIKAGETKEVKIKYNAAKMKL